MIPFIVLSSVFAYLFASAMVYRLRYQYTMRAYLRWKNEHPKQEHRVPRGSGWRASVDYKPRAGISYESYLRIEGLPTPLGYALLWPYLLILFPVDRFVHPPVKIPDIPKIQELEKL